MLVKTDTKREPIFWEYKYTSNFNPNTRHNIDSKVSEKPWIVFNDNLFTHSMTT